MGRNLELEQQFLDLPLEITVRAIQGQVFDAVLDYIAPKGKEENGAIQFEIKGSLKKQDSVFIRAGLSANASIILGKADSVLAVKEALVYDLKRKRLARGASTITQQLAKNIYLSRDKSILRKLRELVLTTRIERELTKGRILELYLNVVEFGPLVYGVGQGASYHFDRPVALLSPAQAAFLAAILPGPRVAFNPETRPVQVRQTQVRQTRGGSALKPQAAWRQA